MAIATAPTSRNGHHPAAEEEGSILVRVTLTGTTPLLLHNGRLANPLDPHTKALKTLTSKRQKTDDDLAAMLVTEARGAAYETAEGEVGLPDANTWRSIQEAAKAYKRGADMSRGCIYDPVHVSPLLFEENGNLVGWDVDDFLSQGTTIDYRPVGVQGRTVMRARPIIEVGWVVEHDFTLLPDVVMLDELQQFAERAGRLQGVGDHRPQYGRFTVEVAQVAS